MTNANGNDAYGNVYENVQDYAQGQVQDQAQGNVPGATGDAQTPAGGAQAAGDAQGSRPAYGAMQSDYPGWNPYVYGAPDSGSKGSGSSTNSSAANAPQALPLNGYGRQGAGNGGNAGAGNAGGMGNGRQDSLGNAPAFPGQFPGQQTDGRNGARQGNGNGNIMWTPYGSVNLDDPAQNPWYGRWDSLSVIAFITTFFMPFVGLVLGCFAMHRTRVFHMKGRGLAIASIVLSVVLLVFQFYLVRSGMYTQLLESISGTSGSGSGSAPSPSTSASSSSSASASVYSA
ncbi:DUF4190 domain-containing protein [Pseudoscardovia suis]